MILRTHRLRLLLAAGVLLAVWLLAGPQMSQGASIAVTRDDAITQLQTVRISIDQTLGLLKEGRRTEAFAAARAGYLDHFEQVEIPLRAANPELTLTAEEKFAEIRSDIKAEASTAAIRGQIVELRGLIDDAERQLTSKGLGAPSLVFGQAFVILFREGLEAVLLLSVLLGYLESTKNGRYKRHIVLGVGLAAAATVLTLVFLNAFLGALPFGREVLEAVTALVAVGVLFYVSFWLVARLEQRRWLEFLRARVWSAVSIGSAASLVLIGFTSVYREGFETALFFQALSSFGKGLGLYVALGAAAAAVALTGVSFAVFRYGRRLPMGSLLSAAVILIMLTSVAFLGNAIASLQAADVVAFTRLDGWPRLPIFLAQTTGYSPTLQTVLAQVALLLVYIGGGAWVYFFRIRRSRTDPPVRAAVASEAPATAAEAAS